MNVCGIPILSAGNYYDGNNREIAKRMKHGDSSALDIAARSMIRLIPRNAVLVPIPGHEGMAKQTLQLCKAISSYTGLPVADVLKGKERESNYSAKHEGQGLTVKDMGIMQVGKLPFGKIPTYIDNVVDTGTTAKAAYQAVGRGVVISFAISNTLLEQQQIAKGIHR